MKEKGRQKTLTEFFTPPTTAIKGQTDQGCIKAEIRTNIFLGP